MKASTQRVALGSTLATLALLGASAQGAERDDLGPLQSLQARTVVHVEILDPATEQIDWYGETNDPGGPAQTNLVEVIDPLGVSLGVFPVGLIDVPIAGSYEVVPIGLDLAGAPALTGPPDGVEDPLADWRFEVLRNGTTTVLGRVWSYAWSINAGTFGAAGGTEGSFYAVVDGGAPGVESVVELKPQGLVGYNYTLEASSEGVRNGNGRSTESYGYFVGDELQVFLHPPDPALVSYTVLDPDVTAVDLAPNGSCDGVAAGAASATLSFESNVVGTYHVVCDLNEDGQFDLTSDDDLHVLGTAVVGVNPVEITGYDNAGNPIPGGTYDCRVRLTVGEFHYVGRDVETSYEGFRLFRVDEVGARSGLTMFWNDAAVAYKDFTDPDPYDPYNPLVRTLMPGGEESLDTSGPLGVDSGDYLDPTLPNVNARSWGNFTSGGKGNDSFLDTYTYVSAEDSALVPLTVYDVVVDTDSDGLSDGVETCTWLTDPGDPDTDSDGLSDGQEALQLPTDPLDADSDGDGENDGLEVGDPLDPTDSDEDGAIDAIDADDDDDGVLSIDELGLDTDGDTIPDKLDDDDDDDGVPTIQEDTDGDGDWSNDDANGDDVPDYLDDDDDGDGLPGSAEDVNGDGIFDDDSDGDGIPDRADPDDDGDGQLTIDELLRGDTDGDYLPDYLDPDDDNDGVLSAIELAVAEENGGPSDPLNPDDDGDGLLTILEDVDGDGLWTDDTDGDGIYNYLDLDDDGDLVPTLREVDQDGDGTSESIDLDSDEDDIPNYLDPDDDNDTIPTAEEVDQDGDGKDAESIELDTDEDGLVNWLDDDDDGDGIPTAEERDRDSDGDGTPDYLDTDADNDTILDADEGLVDSDGDFTPDFQDNDDDGDGIGTLEELQDGTLDTAPDFDGDDIPDYLDPDDDDDGVPTFNEGGFDDDADDDGAPNHHDADADGDGIADGEEGIQDIDVDGDPNFLDLDSDGDGFEDALEGVVDTDGDGAADFVDTDDDNDGVPSNRELPGDTDGDGTPDRIDTDDDGDGILSADEWSDGLVHGDDVDGDGLPNWADTDSDGDELLDVDEGRKDVDADGVPDYLDPDGAITTYYKGGGLISCNTASSSSSLGMLALFAGLGLVRRTSAASGSKVRVEDR